MRDRQVIIYIYIYIYNYKKKKRLDAEDHATKNKLLDLSVAGSLVKEMLVPDVTLSVDKTKLIARLVLRQKGKIYWPIFQLAELVFFRASTM